MRDSKPNCNVPSRWAFSRICTCAATSSNCLASSTRGFASSSLSEPCGVGSGNDGPCDRGLLRAPEPGPQPADQAPRLTNRTLVVQRDWNLLMKRISWLRCRADAEGSVGLCKYRLYSRRRDGSRAFQQASAATRLVPGTA